MSLSSEHALRVAMVGLVVSLCVAHLLAPWQPWIGEPAVVLVALLGGGAVAGIFHLVTRPSTL